DTTPGINIGTVPAGTTPSLYVDGVKVPAAYDAATGTLTPATPLAEGAHQLSYTLTDVAGNESGQSGALSVTVDTTAPASSIVIDITSITDDTGASNADFVTKDTNLIVNGALTGTLGVGEKAQISIDGGANWIDLTVSGGNWSYADGRTLTEGSYTYQVRVVDAAGNVGTTDSQIVTVDTTPPASSIVIDITSISDDTGWVGDFITRDTALTVNGTLAGTLGAGEKAQISVDGGASWSDLTVTGGAWSYADGRTLTDGNYTYQVRVVDTAGNVGTTDSQVVIVDTTPPSSTATIVSFTDNVGTLQGNFASGLTTDDRTPVLNGTTSTALGAGEVVRVYDGTTLVGTATMTGSQTWSFALPNLADGSSHAYRAAVADAAGNESTPSGQFTLHVDLTVVVNAQSTLDTTPIVTGSTGFEIQPGEHVEVTINGKTYSSQTGAVVVDPMNNTWYVQIPVGDALAAGTTYNVVAVLKDALGFVITQDDTVAELVIGSPLAAPTIPGSTDAANKATAMTIGEDGQWRIFSNMTVLDANGTNVTNVASFSTNTLKGNEGVFGSVTFMDFDRDGDMDMFGVDSAYWDGQQAFENRGPGYVQPSVPGTTPSNTNNGYYAFQVGNEALYSDRVAYSGSGTTSANTWSWYGGAAAYDKVGDGYVDMVYGDNTPNDEEAGGGYDTSFVLNDGGATPFRKDPAIGFDSVPWPDERYQATPEKLISTVDLNNDGAVDIAYQGAAGTNYITGNSTITANNYRLVITSNFGNGNLDVTQIVENTLYNQEGLTFDGPSMTWADFDGDGWLDLFQARTYGATAAIQNQSKIFFNDGTGKISANNTDSDPIHESYNRHYNMGDSLAGGGSVAVDWNADGRMDVIEIPYYTGADPNGMQNVLLFSNNSAGGAVSFSQSTLTTMADTGAGSAITGLLTLDLDWDGDRDAIFFTGTAGAKLVQNNASVAEGTSLHLRILDKNGINALYGNTVKLYDSNGNLVATRVLNPQSGNQTSDSSAILEFYGLNPSETYTAVLLRNIGGSSQDVGGVTSIGGHSIENVNASWTGLTTGPAHDAYVLTAEAGGAVNNANTGNGIIGTGYNDTFFATLGADKFDGGGGTTIVSNSRQWSNTGGMDVVDYKLAGSTAINVDLSLTTAQNTGFGSQTFLNIEGIAGGSGNDTFTDSAADNVFNGRGGTDTFHLTHGGRDTLLYELINGADATGGNGSDVIYGFKVGTYEATPNADRIDISQLLSGYTKDADGAAHYINGVATMDAGETIGDFVNVTSSGGITTISIDRDGSGGAFGATPLVTLQNVTTDLETLLANHQIVV
ncbi:beta strand repeat-containing protein, partial [Ensifer sp. CCNWLW38]